MTLFRVIWEIDIEASSHEDAARAAFDRMQEPIDLTDPEAPAVFTVRREDGSDVKDVDLCEIERGGAA